jgi:hypothetical protein
MGENLTNYTFEKLPDGEASSVSLKHRARKRHFEYFAGSLRDHHAAPVPKKAFDWKILGKADAPHESACTDALQGTISRCRRI